MSKNQRHQLHFIYCLTVGGLGQTTRLGKCVMSGNAFCHELENFDQTRRGVWTQQHVCSDPVWIGLRVAILACLCFLPKMHSCMASANVSKQSDCKTVRQYFGIRLIVSNSIKKIYIRFGTSANVSSPYYSLKFWSLLPYNSISNYCRNYAEANQ